jgi:tetratricopeptide (TPR) repeat protein
MRTLLERARMPAERTLIDRRTVMLSALSIVMALVTGFAAQLLVTLIHFVTNFAFFGRFSILPVSPAGHHLGAAVVFIPVVGGLIVGVMARYGSKAIRGHGIAVAMEQEGVFLMCTFWLADNLALLGRYDEAQEIFEKLLSLRNDVGLLAEEYDPVARRHLGNFPQAFSHVALVNTAQNLLRRDGPASDRRKR